MDMDKKPDEAVQPAEESEQPAEQKPNPPKDWGAWQAFSLTSTLGIELAVCTVAGAYFGHKLDEKFNTLPWLTVAGVLLGMAAGVWGIIKTLKQYL